MDKKTASVKPKFRLEWHSQITYESNKASNQLLTDRQLNFVINANLWQDTRPLESRVHFDNCCFEDGAEYIEEEWRSIVNDDPSAESALGALGRILHTVQDFYAHSTWVELHKNEAPIPIWNLDVGTLPSRIASGTWELGQPKKCLGNTPTHEQLNKDNQESDMGKIIISSGPNKGKSMFDLAYNAALSASIGQLKRYRSLLEKANETFEAIVVGSGFGGTIVALSLANKFEDENTNNNTDKRVCILERGQWWLSHEMNFKPKSSRKTFPNMREFLEDKGSPYHFWAHPDNASGILELLSTDRTLTKKGLFDYKVLGNVHSIQASGVGGGSLVYSNVTISPPGSVYMNWPTQFVGKKLEDYFDTVKHFLVVNKIPTNAGLSKNLLEKTRAFQEAGQALIDHGNVDIVNVTNDGGKTIGNFDLDLTITNVPAGLFEGQNPPEEEIRRLLGKQESVCQRQGRCVLGCIPGARHTFSDRLFDAMNPEPPKKPKPLEVRELSEAYDIEFTEGDEYKYKIKYFQYDPNTDLRQQKYVLAKSLIIAAGSLGSTELLLKCKDRGHLKLNDTLGKNFFTNGDILGFMTLEHRTIDVTRGPINTSHVAFKTNEKDFAFIIEDTTIPKMVAPTAATMLELLANGGKKADLSSLADLIQNISLMYRFGVLGILSDGISTTSLIRLFTVMWNDPMVRRVLIEILRTGTSKDESIRKFMEAILTWATTDHANPYASPEERISKFYIFSGMGRGEKGGIVKLKPKWKEMEDSDDLGEKIFINWPAAENNEALRDIVNGMKKLASEMDAGGAKRVYTPFWNFNKPKESTAVILHPLGGCSMGIDSDDGVVDSYGQVFWRDGSGNKIRKYPDLYVVDGSVLPEPPGVNPTMLISAIAFRTAEKIVGAEFLPDA
jgi:choline dehydrogenase-like flavoprotein